MFGSENLILLRAVMFLNFSNLLQGTSIIPVTHISRSCQQLQVIPAYPNYSFFTQVQG